MEKVYEIEPLAKGSKIIKGNRVIILVGTPPFTVNRDDFHYVQEFFRVKQEPPVKAIKPAKEPKEGK